MFMETANQQTALVDFINQSNAAAASYNSAVPIDMLKFKRAMYLISVGAMTASATLDGRLQSCQYSSFNTAVHNITNSNITQIVNTTPNVRVKVEVRSDQVVQQNSADRYVRLNTTVGTAAVNYEATGIGMESEQRPVNQYENTTIVLQNVTTNT